MKRNFFRWMIALVLMICVLPVAAFAEGEEMQVHEHSWIHVPGKAPTCTEGGLSDGERCSECADVWSYKQIELAPLGHNIVTTDAKAPTCTEDGYGNGEGCSRCGIVTYPAPVIGKLGHDLVYVSGTEATCKVPGKSDGEKCNRPGCTYWSIPQVEVTVPHTPEVVKGFAQTCMLAGLSDGSKCSVCGDTLKAQEEIPAHFPKTVPGRAATCLVEGLSDSIICNSCSAPLTTATVLSKTECNWTHVPGKLPSCTESGLSDGEWCPVCKTWSHPQTVLPALGSHAWDEGKVTTAATCGKDGVKTYTCGNAGCTVKTKTEVIPATGAHKLSIMLSNPEYHYQYCWNEGCKYVTTGYHDWSRWRVARTATEEKDGLLRKDCRWCNQKKWSSYKYSDNPPTSDAVVIPAMVMLMSAAALPVAVHGRRKRK